MSIGFYANDTDPSTPGNQTETSCQNAVQNKINNIPDFNTFCSLSSTPPSSTCPSGKTKVVFAQCAYGDIDINNDNTPDFRACKTLNDQF